MSSPTPGEKSLLLPPPIFRMEEGLTPFGCRSPHSPNWGNESQPSPTFPTHIHPATQNKTFHRDLNSASPSTMQMPPPPKKKNQSKIWKERAKSKEEPSLTHKFYLYLEVYSLPIDERISAGIESQKPSFQNWKFNLITDCLKNLDHGTMEAKYSKFVVVGIQMESLSRLIGSTEYDTLKFSCW